MFHKQPHGRPNALRGHTRNARARSTSTARDMDPRRNRSSTCRPARAHCPARGGRSVESRHRAASGHQPSHRCAVASAVCGWRDRQPHAGCPRTWTEEREGTPAIRGGESSLNRARRRQAVDGASARQGERLECRVGASAASRERTLGRSVTALSPRASTTRHQSSDAGGLTFMKRRPRTGGGTQFARRAAHAHVNGGRRALPEV